MNGYGFVELDMPANARVTSAIVQQRDLGPSEIVIYAQVPVDNLDQDPNPKKQKRVVYISPTGRELPVDVESFFEFVDTVQQGEFVWHIFADPSAS